MKEGEWINERGMNGGREDMCSAEQRSEGHALKAEWFRAHHEEPPVGEGADISECTGEGVWRFPKWMEECVPSSHKGWSGPPWIQVLNCIIL